MIKFGQFAAMALLVAACSGVESQTTSTIMLNGNQHDLRTRTVSGANGSFVQHSVFAHGTWRTCLPDSPGSCEAAVRRSNTSSERD